MVYTGTICVVQKDQTHILVQAGESFSVFLSLFVCAAFLLPSPDHHTLHLSNQVLTCNSNRTGMIRWKTTPVLVSLPWTKPWTHCSTLPPQEEGTPLSCGHLPDVFLDVCCLILFLQAQGPGCGAKPSMRSQELPLLDVSNFYRLVWPAHYLKRLINPDDIPMSLL